MRSMAVALVLFVTVASRADAQVSCDDPDNLCTGDPCIMDNVEVLTPCVVDFGPRTLIIRNRLSRIFSMDSSVSLTAGAVVVESGAQVSATKLAATGPLDFRGHGVAITLEAGGLLTMSGSLDASSRCKYADCHGGTQRLHGAGGVIMSGRMLVKGVHAGSIEVTSAAGDITISGPLNGYGQQSSDEITLQAAGDVTIDGDVTTGRGGQIGIAANGDVTVNRKVRGRAESSHVVVDAGGAVRVVERVTVIDGGTIDLSAGTLVQLAPGSLVDATGRPGGSIRVTGADVDVQGRIRAKGKPEQGLYGDAGEMRLTALSGDLVLAGDVYAKGKSGGCTFEGHAAQDLTASGRIVCAGAFGGCIALSAGGTLDTTGATFDLPVVADCPGSPSGAFL
jgi:hypothetical protein